MPAKTYTRQDLRDAAEKYKNWGKWGPNDEIGTLNFTSAADIIDECRPDQDRRPLENGSGGQIQSTSSN